jgi:hypothetical protein
MPTRKIYYERTPWNSFAFEPEYPHSIIEFDYYSELVAHCVQTYGQDIEFIEVTEDNWHELQGAGAFDR